ncbi:glutamate dehydrogenase [Neisseria sp. HSC-16F19]|nr:NAD-glutamate dehydrogenase [Neisseria sp. HSC-16F19]MCP2040949.1 glutamate dehydrogenase [Neisseria sp. HSC-16F19]
MSQIDSLIAQLQQLAESQNQPAEFVRFLQYYYEDADARDLQSHPLAELVAAALSHYRFATEPRRRGQARLRTLQHDAQAAFAPNRTVIEIVADDMPFLIDSLILNVNARHATLSWIVHPVITAQRDDNGTLKQWLRSKSTDEHKESLIQISLETLSPEQAQALAADLENMLAKLYAVVGAESAMRDKVHAIRQQIVAEGRSDQAEVVAFLEWMANNHYLFMGFCEYDLVTDDQGQSQLQLAEGSALGVLANRENPRYSTGFAALNAEDKKAWLEGDRLILNKSQRRANIHRNAYYDLVGIQKLDALGKVVGQWRFIGLYTAQAYLSSVWDIPILRQKCQYVVEHCDYIRGSYKDKMLHFVLQTYPRDELFEIHNADLLNIASGMVALNERPRVRLFTRTDDFKRYVSAIVYLPREQFNTELRKRVSHYLTEAFASTESDFAVQLLGDSAMARVHFMFRTHAATLPDFDPAVLEADINTMVRGWHSDWQHLAAQQNWDSSEVADYDQAFSAGYREKFSPADALLDMSAIRNLGENHSTALRMGTQPDNANAPYWLKMYFPDASPSLSKTLPIIENLGVSVFAEEPYRIRRGSGSVGLSHFSLALPEGMDGTALQQPETQTQLLALLEEVWQGRVENDRFNALVAAAGISWRDSVLMRALAKFIKQATLPFSQPYVEQCLMRHGAVVANLVALFHARLHPTEADEARADSLQAAIKAQLAEVPSIDEDRILNAFMTVILAVERTNFWQPDASGSPKQDVSFKIQSAKIDFLPKPHPLYEIWVYSPRVEGTHLRGAKVARGGLRWSDRLEDFRTEVLGLVKAQMVKNSVIVPHGSKGGFVCKQLPPASEREAYAAEGVACYQIFINALLDITDNLKAGDIEAPAYVHRRDGDDPYLVVAADKGTARFSDVANGIAQRHGFWLDDAFASGGSAGYDHKGMGITARGAWESVKRHFRHLGKDIQKEDFTVIGIGDMGGDVFGNGMLLSEHICLKAAFNHRHIFIDPTPNAAKSFAERKRLFEAVAGWDQYDTSLISQGGGVYERSAKSITLTPEVKAWLKTDADSMAPSALIHELLKAEVELLYNGGIGTYIKASSEGHAQAQDRANDDVRVDGRDIKAKVLGEGGNLGATQLGRIEYWQAGGRCCTDAIDNSAGVDCSDHEVNIKILLGAEVQQGRMTLPERNELLKDMTDDVAKLVLRNNYLQTQVLAMNQLNPHGFLHAHADLINYLSEHAGLNRKLEFLPGEAEIKQRDMHQQGLSNPEVAVLLAYSKIHCQGELLESDLPDDANFLPVLTEYFPTALQQRYQDRMGSHYLKREIIANQMANRVVNRMGISFVQRFSTEMEASVADVVRAYWVASELFDGEARFAQIEALDNQIPAHEQMQLMADFARLLNRVSRHILRQKRPFGNIAELIERYREPVRQLLQQLPQWLHAEEHPSIQAASGRLAALGVLSDADQALYARLPFAENCLSIIDLAQAQNRELSEVAAAYFDLSQRLQMGWLYRAIAALPRHNQWQNQACLAVREDIQNLHMQVTDKWLRSQNDAERAAVDADVERAVAQIRSMQGYEQTDLAMLSALARSLLRSLA